MKVEETISWRVKALCGIGIGLEQGRRSVTTPDDYRTVARKPED